MKPLLAPESWLKQAASHATTKWLRDFLMATLPRLQVQSLSPESFANALEELLLDRSLTSLAQQKNYRSNVCQALKSIDPNHPAILLVSPTTEQYRELNEEQRSKLAMRETKYFSSATADLIVARATVLLESAEWSDVAAGLAVIIGRRISEILLSSFSLCSHWSLEFSEMSKKFDASITIEIPTLAPAPMVLSAIHRLQFSLQIDDLKADAFSAKTAKQMINQRFSLLVAERCHAHFYDLIPLRTDRENLYTHLFRACYATIAAHWFCPVTVPEHTFKSEIQGHFTISQEGHKLPNFSARANYDDYAICSIDGNRDGRLGIKLGLFPELQILTVFRNSSITMAIPSESSKRRKSSKSVPAAGQQTFMPLAVIPTQPPALENTQSKALEPVPNNSKAGSAETIRPSPPPSTQTQMAPNPPDRSLLQTMQWFTSEIDALRAKVIALEEERDILKAAVASSSVLENLEEENAQLRAQLQAIQGLLGTNGALSLVVAKTDQSAREAVPAAHKRQPQAASQDRYEPKPRPAPATTHGTIHRIIDVLLDWNYRQFDPSKRLRISIPIIKELATPFGASYQPMIQKVLTERAEDIDNLHSRLLLGVRHNASVSEKDSIIQSLIASLQGN
jgi:Telomere resolvase